MSVGADGSVSMDQRLIAWARAVKRRTHAQHPILWLFTDATRGRDPLAAAARLPKGLCGVVFRHDGAANRAALGRALARICRARRLGLVVAGDARLAQALRAGIHLRGGRWPGVVAANLRPTRLVTSSAHDYKELRRARLAGAAIVFLSPAFPTESHPGAPALGAARWAALARGGGCAAVYALGGVNGTTAKRLAPFCRGARAIGALGG